MRQGSLAVSRDAVNIRFAPGTELRLPPAQLKALARLVAAELADRQVGPGMTVREAREYLGVSDQTWRESIVPYIPVVRIGRRKIVPRGELDRFMRDRADRLPAELVGDNDNGSDRSHNEGGSR
jgi:hypothetical protein